MKVYTVQSIDAPAMDPIDHCVIGTFTTRGRALDECVDYIMERVENSEDIAWSMAHDENHPEAKKFFSERRSNGITVVKRGCAGKLREFLRDELGGQSCYYVWDGESSWHFDIDENDVKGEMWHTVTWGDGDCEDPEFTTPRPEDFTSQETAVETFVGYVKDLYRKNCMKWSDEFIRSVRKSLVEDGQVQVDLNDGCCVSCVLYRDDAKNVKE